MKHWTAKRIRNALKCGAHPSAKAPESLKCLIAEAKTKVENGFTKIVHWQDIKGKYTPKTENISHHNDPTQK